MSPCGYMLCIVYYIFTKYLTDQINKYFLIRYTSNKKITYNTTHHVKKERSLTLKISSSSVHSNKLERHLKSPHIKTKQLESLTYYNLLSQHSLLVFSKTKY